MLEKVSDRFAVRSILILSAGVVGFLVWFIYGRQTSGYADHAFVETLPLVNCSLNALTTVFVVIGLICISKRKVQAHTACMILATTSSALFLLCYLLYHYFHGDTKFPGQGWIRPVYFFILITHIITSIAVVPLIFTTLFFAASKRFQNHKAVARWTYPVWLYVSVTGILVYLILKQYTTITA